jgi:hypothetical protein
MFSTTIRIWSRNGHTPVTGRGAGYCDELVNTVVDCRDPDHALQMVAELKAQTPGAYACHYSMPDHPNQNTRTKFCHYG